MFSKLLDLLNDSDALTRACRDKNRRKFVDLFGEWEIFCLSLPEPFEKGVDPRVTQEELLELIRTAARDLSQRREFEPFCYIRNGRKRMPLFTTQDRVQQFAQTYVRETKRIIPFQVLSIDGAVIARTLGNADVVVLNDRSEHEYELSTEDIALIRERWV